MRGDCQTVTVTGGLGRMEETLHGRSCGGDEAKVVDVEKDSEDVFRMLLFLAPLFQNFLCL